MLTVDWHQLVRDVLHEVRQAGSPQFSLSDDGLADGSDADDYGCSADGCSGDGSGLGRAASAEGEAASSGTGLNASSAGNGSGNDGAGSGGDGGGVLERACSGTVAAAAPLRRNAWSIAGAGAVAAAAGTSAASAPAAAAPLPCPPQPAPVPPPLQQQSQQSQQPRRAMALHVANGDGAPPRRAAPGAAPELGNVSRGEQKALFKALQARITNMVAAVPRAAYNAQFIEVVHAATMRPYVVLVVTSSRPGADVVIDDRTEILVDYGDPYWVGVFNAVAHKAFEELTGTAA